mmetsp:Transcript_21308/g.52150  ORF Transcript_21308/g.52150 Transcript_21308/m.52150 type:complete len:144 (+) Transcript_21308:685-1116(+)
MPLDSIPISSTLRFVKGSHRWGKEFIPIKFETESDYPFPDKQAARSYHQVPQNIDEDSSKYHILAWEAQPGDIIAFDGLTLHAADGNNLLKTPRRVISWRFLGEDAVRVTRPWNISPPIFGGMPVGQLAVDANSDEIPCFTTR